MNNTAMAIPSVLEKFARKLNFQHKMICSLLILTTSSNSTRSRGEMQVHFRAQPPEVGREDGRVENAHQIAAESGPTANRTTDLLLNM